MPRRSFTIGEDILNRAMSGFRDRAKRFFLKRRYPCRDVRRYRIDCPDIFAGGERFLFPAAGRGENFPGYGVIYGTGSDELLRADNFRGF